MKRKKQSAEYPPIQFIKSIPEIPDALYFSDLADCDNHYAKVKDIRKYGIRETQRLLFSRTAFVAADWARYKQAYKITPELANDLFSMDDLSFPAGSIKMPFRTVYFDLSDLHWPSTGAGVSKDMHAFAEGVFLTYGTVKYDGEDAGFAGFVILTGVPETKELLFGGISFAVDDTDSSKTLGNLIDANAGTPEVRQVLKNILLLAAYISSAKPDILESEEQKQYYRPSRKIKASAVRKWDVGIRYANEVRHRNAAAEVSENHHGTGRSPRPHIRKAHWHIYRIGPGRKETKVLWLAPIEVNCNRNKCRDEMPTVIRVPQGH